MDLCKSLGQSVATVSPADLYVHSIPVDRHVPNPTVKSHTHLPSIGN